MKRGTQPGRSSGVRKSITISHHNDVVDDDAPPTKRKGLVSGPSTALASAGTRGEGSNYLVALAGMRALESHVQDPSRGKKWRDRVASWEERAGLGLPSVKLALGFLDVLRVRFAV